MSDVIWHVTMSLDGFIAGPEDAMDWVVAQWSDNGGGVQDIRVKKSAVAEEVMQTAGAILAGRRWYDIATQRLGGVEGIYGGAGTDPCSSSHTTRHEVNIIRRSDSLQANSPMRSGQHEAPPTGKASCSSERAFRDSACRRGCWMRS
jgi:dihydrofolate reductase